MKMEGQWEWITGEQWTINFWRDGEPDQWNNSDYLKQIFLIIQIFEDGMTRRVAEIDIYSFLKQLIFDPNDSDSDDDGLSDGDEVNIRNGS